MAFKTATGTLHSLNNADGSAEYTSPNDGYTIIAGVNYPVEVPYRSDEIPESTYIEVHLRPHNGVGMVRERHIEEVVRRTLKAIVLIEQTPRLMLQVTLQVANVEVDESLPGGVKDGGQGQSYLNTLTGCINASVLGCMDAGVQMNGIAGAALVAVRPDDSIALWPSIIDRKHSRSLHVFGFSSHQECLLMESEGTFDLDQWQIAQNRAKDAVIGTNTMAENGDVDMDRNITPDSIFDLMRRTVEARVTRDERQHQ